MALVDIGSVPFGRSLAGLSVTAGSHGPGGRIRPDQLAEGGDFLRESGNFMEIFIKHGDADPGDRVKITEHGGQLFNIEGRYHGQTPDFGSKRCFGQSNAEQKGPFYIIVKGL